MAKFFSFFSKRKDLSIDDEFNLESEEFVIDLIERIKKGDSQLQNDLINRYTPFIATVVSSVCKRYIGEDDDEFSIGMIAFNEAIEKFDSDKGKSLLSFAKKVIRSRVIDYIRKEATTGNSESIQPLSNDILSEDIETNISIEEFRKNSENIQRKEEMEQYNHLLKSYELSFIDLVELTPKHSDARDNCLNVAEYLTENEELMTKLRETKKLPLKDIADNVSVSRKTIERNRKYIIALAIILDKENNFLFLKEQIKYTEKK